MKIQPITPALGLLAAAAVAAAPLPDTRYPLQVHARYHVECEDCDVQQSEVSWWDLALNRDGIVAGQTEGHAVLYDRRVRTDLGTLGGSTSAARDVSDAEAVVGESELADGSQHAFYWQAGHMRDLGLLAGAGFSYAGATGINNLGQIVGYSAYGASATHCFATTVTPGAGLQDLGLPPDVPATWNCDEPRLNNRGHVVLIVGDESWSSRFGYLLRDGHWIAMGSLDVQYPNSFAAAVNDADQVVGWSGSSAFLWTEGVLQDLGVLPGGTDGAAALSINNKGRVVGVSSTAGRMRHLFAGFIYDEGRMVDVNDLLDAASSRHWYIERAVDINDDDEIVAVGLHEGQPHTVLLKKRRIFEKDAP
jgi:probable HAF family extracellular repeat protein